MSPCAVVGAGFIGAEVAATARTLGLTVTIVEAVPVPLATALGPEYGTRIQYAGAAELSDEIRFLDGGPSDGSFVATYHRDDVMTAVLAMNNSRLFGRMRRQIAVARSCTR